MLVEILLDDPAQAKLEIYQHILELDAGEYPIHYFEKYTGFSHIKTVNLLNGLAADLRELSVDVPLISPKEKIQIVTQLPTTHVYQRYLLTHSIPYRLLVETLLYPTTTLKEFGEACNLSQSSLMRRLKPLVNYLKSKKIRLNCLKMEVTGRESFVRLMYFNFFWSVNFGGKVYEYYAKEHELDLDSLIAETDLELLKYVEKREFTLFAGISLQRTRLGFFIEEPTIHHMPYPNNMFPAFEEFMATRGIAETYRAREVSFLAYLSIYWPQYFATNDPRLPWVKKHYRDLESSQQQAWDFYQKVADQLDLPNEEKRQIFLLNLQTIFIRDEIFGSQAPKNLDFILPQLKKQHPNYDALLAVVEESLVEVPTEQTDLTTMLTLLCLPLYEQQVKPDQIKVGIVGFPSYFLLYSMINYLEKLPFVEYCLINGNEELTYDAVITCDPQFSPQGIEHWVVEGERSFDQLDDFLFQTFKRKIRA